MDDERLYSPDDLDFVFERLSNLNRQGGAFATAGAAVVDSLRRSGATFVLREERYIDRDYSRAYDAFYGGFFRPPPKFTTRYHFFTRRFDPADDTSTVPSPAEYLGFVVLWETDPLIVGRTVVRPPARATKMLGRPTDVHIGGHRFELDAAPFCAKDFGVAAWATVATYLAAELAGHQYGFPRTSTTEVTQLATANGGDFGRPLPQRFGLTPAEICRALSALGYEPFVEDLESFTWDADATILAHLTSGIPVIILLEVLPDPDGVGIDGGASRPDDRERHAVVAVGYDWYPERALQNGSWTAGLERIHVHDDRYGPFVPITFVTSSAKGGARVELGYLSGAREAIVKQLILPLPPRTYLISKEAHLAGRSVLHRIADRTVPGTRPSDLLIRTYLIPSSELKREATDWGFGGPAAHLLQQSLPHRVWVSEAWLLADVGRPGGKPSGRALCDPTALRDATRRHVLWSHYLDDVHDVDLSTDS
ncbi:MAG: hypothetical protein IT302_05255 [Dehalococcoidia bacterium]|nr:hypothetical protein [Dehalococcoidia bacterium]